MELSAHVRRVGPWTDATKCCAGARNGRISHRRRCLFCLWSAEPRERPGGRYVYDVADYHTESRTDGLAAPGAAWWRYCAGGAPLARGAGGVTSPSAEPVSEPGCQSIRRSKARHSAELPSGVERGRDRAAVESGSVKRWDYCLIVW